MRPPHALPVFPPKQLDAEPLSLEPHRIQSTDSTPPGSWNQTGDPSPPSPTPTWMGAPLQEL